MSNQTWQKRVYCWMGSARYTNPLDTTSAKKWRKLSEGLDTPLFVVGFSVNLRPRSFMEYANFVLLPRFPIAILRYITIYTLSPWVLLWLMFVRRVTVFIAQGPYEGAIAAFAKQIGRALGKDVKLIVETHDNFEEDLFLQRHITFKRLYRALMRVVARYAFRHTDVFRVISQSTHDQIQKYMPDKPVIRFMAWTDDAVFRELVREKSVSESRDFVYGGALIPRKGLHYVLEAFARLPLAGNLYLVGPAKNEVYENELREQASRLGILDHVHFVGDVPQAELARYFGKARAKVLFSISEGLGRVVIEAMLCGTPVIGSRVGGIPDIISDGENGYLVQPEDVDSLATTMQRVLDDANIETLAAQAKLFASQYFSAEGYVEYHRRMFRLLDHEALCD